MTSPTLTGTRVRLMPMRMKYSGLIVAWRNGERGRWLNAGATTVKAQLEWMTDYAHCREDNFLIWHQEQRRPVGTISLLIHGTYAELARELLGEELPGCYICEAERLLLDWAFSSKYAFVSTECASLNTKVVEMRKYFGWAFSDIKPMAFRKGRDLCGVQVFVLTPVAYEVVVRPKLSEVIERGSQQPR
jgi:hypothetical protein